MLFLGFGQTLENFSLHNKVLFGEVGVPLPKTVSTTVIGNIPDGFLGVFPQLLPLFFLGWKRVPFLMRHHQVLSRIVLVWEIYPKGSAALALCVRGPYLNGKAQNHQRPWYTQSTS